MFNRNQKCFYARIIACVCSIAWTCGVSAQSIAYIHGDVSSRGAIPSGSASAFDQMLITDTGDRGMSEFRGIAVSRGYTMSQHYDQNTTLTRSFLSNFDLVVFGLHQKRWSFAERTALHRWIRRGGSIWVYNDSAAGGSFMNVGLGNRTGQRAINPLIRRYGMEVAVDQAGGTVAVQSPQGASQRHPIVSPGGVFEGEGVSPVAVSRTSNVRVVIPYNSNALVSGRIVSVSNVGRTINNPVFAAMAVVRVRDGFVLATFDRQPMWNNGGGSNITQRDNERILRRAMRFLVGDL